jgi:hypothetical protein
MKKIFIPMAILGIANVSNAQDSSKSQLLINHLGFAGQDYFPHAARASLGYLHKISRNTYMRAGLGFARGAYQGFSNRTIIADTVVEGTTNVRAMMPTFSLGLEKRFAITKNATFFYGADAVLANNIYRQEATNTTLVSGALVSQTQQNWTQLITNLQAQVFMGVRYNVTPGFFVSYQVSNAIVANTWQQQQSSFQFFPNNRSLVPFSPRQTLALGFRLKK